MSRLFLMDILRATLRSLNDPKNRADFEQWYEERYHKKYEPRGEQDEQED